MNYILETIVRWLERESAISSKEVPLFAYGLYSFIWGLLPVYIITVIGIMFNMLREGFLLILPFMLIRKFSGGYHFDSARLCFVATVVLLSIALRLAKLIIYSNQISVLTFLVLLSVVCICICSPADNCARKLSRKEQKVFRLLARIIVVVALASYLWFVYKSSITIAAPLGIGIIIPALLQLPCILSSNGMPRT